MARPANASMFDPEALQAMGDSSPELHARIMDLCHMALDEAEYIMENGTPELQQPLIRSFLAFLTRPQADDGGSSEIEAMRLALVQQNEGLVSALLGGNRALPKPPTIRTDK